MDVRRDSLLDGNTTQCDLCLNLSKVSNCGKLFLDTLERIYNIKIEREFLLQGYYYDGRIDEVLIETDGTFWHKNTGERDQRKTLVANKHGYQLFRIELDSVEEVEKAIQDNKVRLDSLFNRYCKHLTNTHHALL